MDGIQMIQQLIAELQGIGVWTWAGLVTLVVGIVRIWRSEPVQKALQPIASSIDWLSWLYWDNLKPWIKWLIPFVVAFGATLYSGVTGGLGWIAAIVSAVAAALAVVAHHGTKIAGKATSPIVAKLPEPARTALSIVLPMDKRHMAPKLGGEG